MDIIAIRLAALWIALMLVYLLGDVLRIFSGDFPNTVDTAQFTKPMWLGISVLMSIPIFMILVNVMLAYPLARWANIAAAVFFFLFNLVGLPTYPSGYDRYLIVVGLVFNVMTVWIAWHWV